MAQIARMLRRAFQAPNMIDLVINSVSARLRAVGAPPLPMLPSPRRRANHGPPMPHRGFRLVLVPLLLRAAVRRLAGELALVLRPRQQSRAGRALNLLATMMAKVGTARKIKIAVNPSLLATNLPTMGGTAVALVAPAVADLAENQVAAPTEEAEMCLGTVSYTHLTLPTTPYV